MITGHLGKKDFVYIWCKSSAMKKILLLLLVLNSACLFSQSKEETFAEINTLLKKAEGQSIGALDGGENIQIMSQVLNADYSLKAESGGSVIGFIVKALPWKSYSKCVEQDNLLGLVIYSIVFDKEFALTVNNGVNANSGNTNHIDVYVYKTDIEKFNTLLKTISTR